MANTDKRFHQLTREVLQEALSVRSYATSDQPDAVWKHTRRTMRACQALLTHLSPPQVTDANSEGRPHENTPTPTDSHEITHTGGN
jgi:hypothetical protein